MSRQDAIKKLIDINQRRLQKLKEQEAMYGKSVEPSILLEIEDIEDKLKALKSELAILESSSSNIPFSLGYILAGIMITVIGGVVLAFIVQEGRFALLTPTATHIFTPTSTNIPVDTPAPKPNIPPEPTTQAIQTELAQQATQTEEARIPPPGRIVFTSNRSEGEDLYWINSDGSGGITQITDYGSAQESDYSKANDGIAFSRKDMNPFSSEEKSSLYSISITPDSRDERKIGPVIDDDWEPSFSPDGKRIAFVSTRENRNWEIYVMNNDTEGSFPLWLKCEQEFYEHELFEEWLKWSPTWEPSPDGERIAFVVQKNTIRNNEYDGEAEIWSINADSTDCRRLTTDNGLFDKRPDWSPDGKQIAFSRVGDGIYLLDVESGVERKLTNAPNDANYPTWSPDGEWLAFTSNGRENRDIFIMPIEGGEPINLTNDGEHDYWYPNWLPN